MTQDLINTKIAVFKGKEIRKTIHNNEWWFVIVDVIAALTDSVQPKGYLKDMRRRDEELSKGWGRIATPFRYKPQEAHKPRKFARPHDRFRAYIFNAWRSGNNRNYPS